jgi:hypothetical protein
VRQWRERARAGGVEAEQAGVRVARGVDVQAHEALAQTAAASKRGNWAQRNGSSVTAGVAAGACERWAAGVEAWARELGTRGRRWSEWRKRVEAWQRAALVAWRYANGAEAWRLGTDPHEGKRVRAQQYLGKDGREGTCDAARPRRVRTQQQEEEE